MMTSKLDSYIKDITKSGSKVLSVFLTSGFPIEKDFVDLSLKIFEAGADIIELGVPFSDPIADGTVIQQSSNKALENGISLEKTLAFADAIKQRSNKPIVLMGYANPFLHYGIEKLSNHIKQIGIDGIIVPDVPVEEYDNFFGTSFNDIDTILLVSPTTPKSRLEEIGNKSKGFIYCVSVKGITGKQNNLDNESLDYVKKTKSFYKKKNLLVGFGISNEQKAKSFSQTSDGVIVGSAVIKLLINSNGTYNETLDFVKRLKRSISN